VAPFGEEVQVEVGQQRTELVRIDEIVHAAGVMDAQRVPQLVERPIPRQGCHEQPFRPPAFHRDHAPVGHDLDRGRRWLQRANDGARGASGRAE
jgi:hypothetical protein